MNKFVNYLVAALSCLTAASALLAITSYFGYQRLERRITALEQTQAADSIKVMFNMSSAANDTLFMTDSSFTPSFFRLHISPPPDSSTKIQIRYYTPDSAGQALRDQLINHPPVNEPIDGWMDRHIGPWTSECVLMEIEPYTEHLPNGNQLMTARVLDRTLATVTVSTFCDVVEHYGNSLDELGAFDHRERKKDGSVVMWYDHGDSAGSMGYGVPMEIIKR